MARISSYPKSQVVSPNIETSFLIRGLDLIVSGCGLLLLAPLFLVVGLMIKLTSPGPVFYRGNRVGQGGRPFKLYKFRSMVQDAERRGPGITGKDDPRITTVGRFLRRAKLDELPQLINILRGDMSLVGPRPEDPRYVAFYTAEQRQLLSVRPGITSPASLYYRQEEGMLAGDDWERTYRERILPHKLALDLAYLRERTVWTDLALILSTLINAVFHGRDRANLILKLRNRHILLLDTLALAILPAVALSLRLEGLDWWSDQGRALILYTLVALVVKVSIFYTLGLYNRYWAFAGVNDLITVGIAIGLSAITLTVLFLYLHPILTPYCLAVFRTVPVIDGLLTPLPVIGFRFGLRGLYYWQRRCRDLIGGRRVLVVGAGEAGAMAARELRANPQLDMEPVAFADDNPAKLGTVIQGLPVLGNCDQIPDLVDHHRIQRIIVAMPSVPLQRQRDIIALCERTGVATHNLPGVYELLAGHKTLSRLPQIDINQLLHREPVAIEQSEVAAYLSGAQVLVTGAGGSIGSELCRQIARFKPAEIILLGHGENSIAEIGLDLRLSFPDLATHQAILDVRDLDRVKHAIKAYRPQVIFHAAAHKHVPIMEADAQEAIANNVLGTWNVLRAAEEYGVERFVLISTDKAVNPTCVMGATKRMAELLMVAAAQRTGHAYMAVRFGNVLGSRGSVIPIFQRQIAAGGPLTVTHPDMCRYFMTIPEAVQLVLQASVLGQGGEVFVLDMGQPVRILDLATDLIKLSGLEPGRDIEIAYTGVRPGEKLNEELFLDGEDYQRTRHHKIFVANNRDTSQVEAMERVASELVNLAGRARTWADIEQLRAILLQVCYYIDNYPFARFNAEPSPTPAASHPRPSLSLRALPTRA
jgi:FlaA1/EpsC-like NDP-sugar epimerase/lipopolysaccharide/colanic/teichoic acid biosynthesis glycosyltransferase